MMPCPPEHQVMVTPLGPAFVTDCSCGLERRAMSKRVANINGLLHLHQVLGGCACPPEVVALDLHPTDVRTAPAVPAAGSTA